MNTGSASRAEKLAERATGSRAALIAAARERFERGGVRWHMMLLVAATAGIGLLASMLLLALGLHVIWLRYVLATAIAYAAFLGLVRWWIKLSGADGSAPGDEDGSGGGGFARGAMDIADQVGFVPNLPAALPDVPADGFQLPDLGDVDLGNDDSGGVAIVVLLVAVVAAIVGGIIAAGVLIWTAPVFFAEVFVDAGLSYGLYRHLRRSEAHSWLQDAVARSWIPFAAVAVLLGAAGYAMHWAAPDAHSIGGVMKAIGK